MPTPSHRRARRRGMIIGSVLRGRRQKAELAANTTAPVSDTAVQLNELKQLLDQGILTQEEFDAKKKQILGL
jgi:hypothetical protein